MEKNVNSKETIKKVHEDLVKKFIDDKLSSEEFTEKQKGMISIWLNEALTLGRAIGEEEGYVNSNPEAIDKIVEMMTTMFDDKDKDDELAKKVLEKLRWIVKGQSNVIGWYDSMLDDLVTDDMKPKHKNFVCVELVTPWADKWRIKV
jgi:hypothetical protein